MKRIKVFTIIGLLCILSFQLHAQISLPYFTGFDNVPGQAGWIEIKKGATTFSHWGIVNYGAFSDPNYLSHSYSPSSGISLTDNWFVSPEFFIPSGGKLDSIRYMFSGFSVPNAGDTIAIYLLQGSQDPAQANSKILLFDFRNSFYQLDDTFRIQSDIILPPYSGPCYLAIRYRNSDCSTNWLTVAFDNIAINGNSVGIKDSENSFSDIKVYPNPTKKMLKIDVASPTLNSLEILNLLGQPVLTTSFFDNVAVDISDFSSGIYFLKLTAKGETIMRKIVKE